MNPIAALHIAIRFLFGSAGSRSYRRIRGGVIGVGLSLIPLIVVLQVADGMIAGITERYIETGSSHIRASARQNPDEETLSATLEALRSLDGVKLVAAEKRGLGLAAFGETRTAVTIRAVEPDLWDRDEKLREYVQVVDGEWSLGERSILLGESVAAELGARVGDTVRVLTARTLSGGRIVPRTRTATVTGIVTSGYADLDRLWVFLPFSEGFRLLPDETSQTIVGIKTADPLSIANPLFRPSSQAAADAMRTLVREVRDQLGVEYRVSTWFEAERPTYMSFKTTKDLLVFIMILIVVVAAINISSALVMLVLEKQEEIAVLKSYGTSPATVVLTFVIAGVILGALGTLLGIGVGLLIAVNINEVLWAVEAAINGALWIGSSLAGVFTSVHTASITILSPEYYLQEIPIRIRFADVALVSVLTIMLAAAAALFPARRAGRVRPLEVLRRH